MRRAQVEDGFIMEVESKERTRERVLERLGLAGLVTPATMDIAAPHGALVERQSHPARFVIDGLTIEAPAGIYHPSPDSSSEFFIRNLREMKSERFRSVLEIGAGCGAISLYVAARWKATVVASDISRAAVAAIERNAEANGLSLEIVESDMFERIPKRTFDLIVFNAPLIDKAPENAIEQYSLCDPNGAITHSYLRGAKRFLNRNGLAIVSICRNSAYEVFDDLDLNFKVLAFEMSSGGFWRAIVGATLARA